MLIEKTSYLWTVFSLFFACTVAKGSGVDLAFKLEKEAKAAAAMQASSAVNPLGGIKLTRISSSESLYSSDGDQIIPTGVRFVNDGVQMTSVSPIQSEATYGDSRRPSSTSFFEAMPVAPLLRRHIESQTTGPSGQPCCSCGIFCCVLSCFNPCGNGENYE